MNEDLRSITDLNRVIHEPSRLLVVTILSAVEEADFLFLLRESGLTKGNLSAHLSKLEKAAYVEIEKTFVGKMPRTVVRLSEAGRKAFTVYRKQLKTILEKSQGS